MDKNFRYLEHLWFVMHHSDDPNGEALAITCYLDESGTDADSLQAVIGGLLLNKHNFCSFDLLWGQLLLRYKIDPPIHMNEFGQHGRLGYIPYTERKLLFSEIAELINSHKVISIASTLNQEQYKNLPKDIQNNMSLYGFCFMLCAYLNRCQAEYMKYPGNIPFVLEHGFGHPGQIVDAYYEIIRQQNEGSQPYHMGSLTIADKRIAALQAADIIVWGIHRTIVGKTLDKGFEPIAKIFNKEHLQKKWNGKWLRELSKNIIKKYQSSPKTKVY